MKITDDVRKYAEENGLTDEEALAKGMDEKSEEFRAGGSQIYVPTPRAETIDENSHELR